MKLNSNLFEEDKENKVFECKHCMMAFKEKNLLRANSILLVRLHVMFLFLMLSQFI